MKTLLKIFLLGMLILNTQTLLAQDKNIVALTNSNYLSKLLKSDKPTVVKFWASWCRACTAMTPEYEKASIALKGKVNFASVNVDTQGQVAQTYQIHALPTIILFKKDKVIQKFVGSLSQTEIEDFIKSNL
jgi:thioredoxin